ncbi:hypothetical protein AAFC00_001679 [Neodothiora populina]|uniref:Acetyl-CoA synthetase-like protein n=1 Tax=Neodothiora populina TaxID=2781224 RepID=A0ABR3PQ11_9PEZI
MPFKSLQPDIDLPTDLTIWDWLFTSPTYSPLQKHAPNELAGYLNAITKERLSYAQVKDVATHVSTALHEKYGFASGDTVALFSQNSIWYPVAMLATLRIGGVVSGASPAYNVEEMTYALKTSGARFLMTHPASLKVAVEAAENAGIPKENLFLLEGQMDGFTTIQELAGIGKKEESQVESFRIPAGKRNGDVCGFLSFSSGTTGLPKAVMISHQNVIAQCLQVQQLTPDDHKRVLAVLPLFHITGLVHVLHLPVLINAEVIMLPSFSMSTMLDAISTYKIAEVLLVPPILIRLVRDPIVDSYDLKCIKRFSSGAAPLSPEILSLLQKKFPQTGFKQGYGMTESCSCITSHPPQFYDYKYAHTVGRICASTTVKIMLPDGTETTQTNEPGEILAKGPQIVMGYLNNASATRENFDADGYLHTGDLGSISDEGIVAILDRLKEMIKVKGIAVAPAELEDLLLGHPAVEDVAVLGIPDEYRGEVPKAYVVLRLNQNQNQDEDAYKATGRLLLAYVRDNKVRHKHVKEIEFASAIPKSASGKILRRVLRDQARAEARGGAVVRDDDGGRDGEGLGGVKAKL